MKKILILLIFSLPVYAQQDLTPEQSLCLFKADIARSTQLIRQQVPNDGYVEFEHNAKLVLGESRGRTTALSVAKQVFQISTPEVPADYIFEVFLEVCLRQSEGVEV